MSQPLRLLAAGVALTFAVGACTGGEEQGIDEGTTTETTTVFESNAAPTTSEPPAPTTGVDGDVKAESVDDGDVETGQLGSTEQVIETDEGRISIGGGDVPADLKSALPLPADFQLQLSSETDDEIGVSGTSAKTVAELAEFYDADLPAAGFTIESRDAMGENLVVYVITSAAAEGQLALSATPGSVGATILVSWTPV